MSENKPPGGHRLAARRLLRATGKAVLASAMADDGAPYASLVTIAPDVDGSPILLLSRLADHTRNVAIESRVALLFDGTDGFANPQEGPRLTVLGTLATSAEGRLRRRFLARHPAAALYAGFADFAFFRLSVERSHWVGGFARAVWLGDGVIMDAAAAAGIGDAEEDILRHMNGDHAETLDLYARSLLGREERGWTMTGVDPDGCDLRCAETYARLSFEARVDTPEGVRNALVELARRAHQAAP